jgi:maltose alpha-D-glucosyltransferase / alpha-amylase
MQSSTSCTSRIFKDGNAERVGDFPGLIQKLDHLQDLGVTCLWLRPRSLHTLKTMATTFRPDERPLDVQDNGGSRGLFLAAALERDLQTMIEVVNHISDQDPWFQGAR